MRVSIFRAVIAALVSIAFAAFVWPTRYREIRLQPTFREVLAARQDRFSGAVQLLTPGGWVILAGPRRTTPLTATRSSGDELDSLYRLYGARADVKTNGPTSKAP